MMNKNAFFSMSGRTIIKNLEEIIDIEDINIKIYKKQNIINSQSNQNESFIDYIFPPSKTLFGINTNNNIINIARIEDIMNNNNNFIDYTVLPEKEEYDKNKIIINKGLWKKFYFLNVVYSHLKYPSIIYKLFRTIAKTKMDYIGYL